MFRSRPLQQGRYGKLQFWKIQWLLKISNRPQVHAVLFVVRLESSGPPLIIRIGMKEAWLRD
jgi:hypothetical protein